MATLARSDFSCLTLYEFHRTPKKMLLPHSFSDDPKWPCHPEGRKEEKVSAVVNATGQEFVTVDTSEPHSDTRSKSVSSGEHGAGHFLSTPISLLSSFFVLLTRRFF